MAGINFSQLRTATNPGLEGSGATDQIQVKANGTTGGLAVDANGVGINLGSGTVTLTGATWNFDSGSGLTRTGTSFSGTDVPNADWVSSQLATGVSWGYPVLDSVQLDDTGNGAIRQAIAFYLVNDAAIGDTFQITDGSTTETWTAIAGASAGFSFQQGTSAALTMQELANQISAASTLWDAVLVTGLNSINTSGNVVIIYRTTQVAANDRIKTDGTANTTPADWQYVNFNGADDYTNTSSTQLGTADPAQKEFGPGKLSAGLTPGEAHVALNGDSQYVWDADSTSWTQISGTGSITAGAGLSKSGNTININSGTGTLNGIQVNTDTIGLALGTSGGLKLTTNELFIEPADFAGTGLEDDGSDNLRIAAAAAGNGLTGGGGSALAVQADATTGGNVEPANVTSNGVGINVANIAGSGLEADGSANLRIAAAAAGAGLSGGAGSALAVDGSEATMKTPCRYRYNAASEGNITNLATNAPLSVDGQNVVVGDRILLDGQSTGGDDGIYRVTVPGAGSDGTWVRTDDAPVAGEAAGWYIQVLEGTSYADTLFRVDADLGAATIGTDGWTLATFSGSDTTRSAGEGLVDGTGLNLDINLEATNPSLQIVSDELGIKFASTGGLQKTAAGTGILLPASSGLSLTASGLAVDPSDGITTDANGTAANVAVQAAGGQYGAVVKNLTAAAATGATAGSGYLGVATDNSTLGVNASNQLAVQSGGITETQLNASVAGDGLTGGGGTVLAVGAGTGLAVAANDIGIDTATGTVTFTGGTWTFPTDSLQITGTPDSANDGVNKAYVDNNVSGLAWKDPIVCHDLVGNATVATINGLSPNISDSYVVTDTGTITAGSLSVSAGDVVEYDGSVWRKIVSNSGGFVPAGTRFVLSTTVALIAPFTDGVDDGKFAEYDGTSNLIGAITLTSPVSGDAVLVVGVSGETQPVDDNRAYTFDGTVPTGTWVQFSGGGTTNAGTGLTLDGNTLNVNDTAVTNTNATIITNADSIEVKYEAAGAGAGGLTDVSGGLRVNVEAAGAGTGGLELTASGIRVDVAPGLELTASGVGVDLEAAGANTGGLAFNGNEIRVARDITSTGAVASVIDLNANGVAVRVDDSTIEGSAAAGSLRVKDLGISTGKLAADAVTIAKLGVSFRQDEFTAASFTFTTLSTSPSLSKTPLTDTKSLGFIECLRNGVADMTNTGAVDPTTATDFRVVGGGTDVLRIGTDITATGNTYRVYYLSADLTA